MAALGALMRSDVLPRLWELKLRRTKPSWHALSQPHTFSWEDIAPLFDGMVAGARAGKPCRLRNLFIVGPNALDGLAAARIARSTIQSGWPLLRVLEISGPVTCAGVEGLVEVLRSVGSGSKLKSLRLMSEGPAESGAVDIIMKGREDHIGPSANISVQAEGECLL
jgi:hypothetical protein